MNAVRKFVVVIVAAVVMSSLVPNMAFAAATELPQPVTTPEQLPASPILITAYQISGGSVQFIQLYNNTNELVDLSGGAVVFTLAGSSDLHELVALAGLMKPRSHVIMSTEGVLAGYAVAHFSSTNQPQGAVIDSLSVVMPGVAASVVPATIKTNSVIQQRGKTSTGYSTVTFGNFDGSLYADAYYEPPASPALRIVEVLPRAKTCEPFTTDPVCGDYIKLKILPGFDVASMGDYRLRNSEASESVSNRFSLEYASRHGDYLLVRLRDDGQLLSLANGGGYVWLEDLFGIQRYPETMISYADAGSEKFIGQSWALDERDGLWKWGVPTPVSANVFPEVLATEAIVVEAGACPAGKYRNPETNRCRSLEDAVSELAACEEGKERNPLTNRCRSIATLLASATLAPCDEGQERNPATNRCRKVSSAATSLVPCASGQERNPETNRCRKIVGGNSALTSPAVAEPAKLGSNLLQTVLLVTVGIAALSYGVFEWRHELWRLSRRGVAFVSRK